ncbi:GNAT family N-acetyltransferase [Sphingobacterium sp. lm-10]|uniref:GNAT family N-acetyltransferase n=1 Tax=Sphingobacterium sp. lm-10 TaxID=2944904 RepID=UPI00202208D9|nr:GNAT family N-acetyltransferase [Sphingobacterium sp. lm-10]MCL7987827.1 GNAT family N-acetyltransferase [Sphingobacterium sp. lm-10]
MDNNLITLKKYESADFADYYSMVGEYAVMRYITEKALSEEEARDKFDSILKINAENNRLGYFKAINEEGLFIGDCKLEPYPQDRRCLEVGYILKEVFWGRGYATVLCKRMLELADSIKPEADIIGIIDPANVASKYILQKAGFESYFIGTEDDLPTEKLRLSRQ